MKKIILFFLMFNASMCFVFGQKLPTVQTKSVRAPQQVKFDNKDYTWNDSLSAYNKTLQLYYSLSNNNENLFLSVKADNPRTIQKLMAVGLTLTINKDGKQKQGLPENIILSYPNLNAASARTIVVKVGADAKLAGIPTIIGKPDTTFRPGNKKEKDSMLVIANTVLSQNAKTIKVKGISGIEDEEVSIYNEFNVRAECHFDKNRHFKYLLSIPLKLLNISYKENPKFFYNLKLVSRLEKPKKGLIVNYYYPNGVMTDEDIDLDTTTDFWGDYTLCEN